MAKKDKEDLQEICRNCGACCFDTELELSEGDIRRISKRTGLHRTDFAVKNGNIWQLKNIEGHCVFLKPDQGNQCTIYEFRPFGCTTYPMVYDVDSKSCWLDDFCPHRKKFYRNKQELVKTCIQLKEWINENFHFS